MDGGALGGGGDFPATVLSTSRGKILVRHAGRPGAEPVVFVHGLGGESLDWSDVATLLADRFDCYALDLPGFGNTAPPSDHDLSIDAHARAVVSVIEVVSRATGANQVHLVGNSLGGAVATRVAAEHPERVRSLALISPALPDLRPTIWTSQLLVALVPVVGPWIVQRLMSGAPERMARRVVAVCFGNPRTISPQQWEAEVEAIKRRAGLAHASIVYRASLRALVSEYLQPGRHRLWRQAATVRARTLLIYGGRDKLVDSRMAVRAERTFRDSRTVLMLDAGHVAHLEFPDRVATTLRAFLDKPLTPLPGMPPQPGMVARRGTVRGSAG